MADSIYDAIVIGGGNKALVTAMYLQRYGKMNVAIFEAKHEIGGCLAGDEASVPGFYADQHATDIGDFYWAVVCQDFPEFEQRGFEFIPYEIAGGGIFEEDHSSYLMYSPYTDPTQEKTAQSFEKFSSHDADTWLKIWEMWEKGGRDAFMKYLHTPPPADPNEPDYFEKFFFTSPHIRDLGFDRSFLLRSPVEVFRDFFDDEALIAGLLRIAHSWNSIPSDMCGAGVFAFFTLLGLTHFGGIKGGTHTAAHAAYKVFTEDGGKCFTKHKVERVLVEGKKAVGVELAGGEQVKAKKLVVSGASPHQLVFEFTGEEHWNRRILKRVANLSYWQSLGVGWNTWAVQEPPEYIAAKQVPEVANVGWLTLGNKNVEEVTLSHYYKKLGMQSPHLDMVICNQAHRDKSRIPEGKWSFLAEDYSSPGNYPESLSDREWRDIKRAHAEKQMSHISKFAPNITWDTVIGYNLYTHFDLTRMLNLTHGCWTGIAHIPSQLGRYRPVPELADHRTPIKGLYGTGVAWHYAGMASCTQGYNCYKIIAEDFGLGMPGQAEQRGF
ncbi:conserved hypothetical protein [delta proteobacterium NaphS2]|nr:conserved hypothetical protein [delta proteobacterium NaphS2]